MDRGCLACPATLSVWCELSICSVAVTSASRPHRGIFCLHGQPILLAQRVLVGMHAAPRVT